MFLYMAANYRLKLKIIIIIIIIIIIKKNPKQSFSQLAKILFSKLTFSNGF